MRILFLTNVLNFYITREPLGLEYLSAVARNLGHETAFGNSVFEDADKAIRKFQPQIVAYSVVTGQQRIFLNLNQRLKAHHDFYAIFGGHHTTFWPEMVKEKGVDAICRGEGELAFSDFLRRFETGGDFHLTPNWWVKKDGQVFENEIRPLEGNIDDILWPDRQSVFDKFPDAAKTPVKCFVANRGCPFNCAYCFNEFYWSLYQGKGKRVRVRDPQKICDEINSVRQVANLQMTMFTADIFAYKKSWLAEFSEVYRKTVGLPYYGNIHANYVDDDYARLLAESGCVSVGMGIEAGNDHVRREIFLRNQTKEDIIQAARALKKHNIALITYNILGVPNTDIEVDYETLDLNRTCKVDYASCFSLVPFPGTKIYEWVKEQGIMDMSVVDNEISYYGRSVLPISKKKERERLYNLFAFGVAFTPIRKAMPFLIRLPLNPIYQLANRLYRGWKYKHEFFPVRHGLTWTLKAAWRYLFFEHR